MRLFITFAIIALLISVQGCSRFTPSRSNPSLPKSPPQPVEVTLPSQVASDLPTLEAATHSGDAKALARYGSALAQSGRTKEGIGYLRRAVARDPQLTAAWHNLALVAESEGWLDVAANAYSKVVSAKPELAGEWVKFGYTLIALGRYAEAETAFKKAVALQPRSSETLVALASLYYADFHFDKALDTLNLAKTLNPRSAAAFVNIAAIQLERHKEDDAENAIRSAIALEPKSMRYRLILCSILSRSSNPEKRAEAFRELQKMGDGLSPEQRAETASILGILARENHDITLAIQYLRQSMELDPSRADTHLALGRLLIPRGGADTIEGRALLKEYEVRQKRRDEEQKLRQRVEQYPNDGEARLRLGIILREQGRTARAVWELQQATRLLPGASTHAALAQALQEQGRNEATEL